MLKEQYIPGRYSSVQMGMDFASGNDKTAYTIKKGDQQMVLESRFIVLRSKYTGRYLTIGDLRGKIVTGTVEDIRCAYVFDAENNDILSVAENLLTDEWEIEYIVQQPLRSSLGYDEQTRPILKEVVEITAWSEADGGFSLEPIKYKEEFGVKVRPYKLDCTFREFGNKAGNQIGFNKIDTPHTVNLIVDRDIYLPYEAFKKVQKLLVQRMVYQKVLTKELSSLIEQDISKFIKTCFLNNEASFIMPLEPAGEAMGKLQGDPDFEYY